MFNESDIEKSVLDFKDETNIDIKIKPNFYIHMALLMAQRTLMISVFKSDIRDGIVAYSILIEHIEMLCRASEYLSDDYDQAIKDFKADKEYIGINNDTLKNAKLSNYKLQMLMKEVFSRSPSENPLSDKDEL